MAPREWWRAPRPLLVLLVASSLGSVAALAWTGWKLMRKERAAEEYQSQQQLEEAADHAEADLRGSLALAEARLGEWMVRPPSGEDAPGDGLLLIFEKGSFTAYPPRRLLYRPAVATGSEASAAAFAGAESVEFQQNRPEEAARMYEELAGEGGPELRAGALLRLGRALIKSGKRAAALEAYARLAALGEVRVAGVPAELVGRHARAKLLAARAEADSLRRDLETGRWALTRGQFAFYWSESARLLGAPETMPAEGALAEAAAAAWAEFQRTPDARGLSTIWIDERPWFLLRRAQATLIGRPERLLERGPGGGRFVSEWLDAEGRVVAGRRAGQGRAAVRLMARTQLPWTLSVTQDQPALATAAGRERLLLLGLAVMIGLIGLGSYFMARAIRREAAVARLQSDFVSAVSHEFRSPLTALRHLSEMLALGRVPDEERRLRYYETLVSETRRLQRLVESLLNFGRMEAGATPYRAETLDPAAIVERVAAEFEPFVSAAGRRIEVSAPGNGQRVEADPEALALALRNLIDNALKYSPGRPAVWVECAGVGQRVAIRVRDEGLGIGPGEQRAIFRKFVRGSAAGKVNAKGTGVGLAMVQHIVRAHGGEIQLESEPGKGSTFTVLLPAVKSL